MKRRSFIYKSIVFAGVTAGSHWATAQKKSSANLTDFEDNFESGLAWCKAHKAQLFIKKGTYSVTSNWQEFFNNQTTLRSALKFNGNQAEFLYDVAIDFGEPNATYRSTKTEQTV